METVTDFIFLDSKITADGDFSQAIKRCLLLGRKAMTNLDSILESRDVTLLTKVHLVKAIVFPVVIWMWELDYKESWALKNWCLWTVVLEKTLESTSDYKEIKPVNRKGYQSWIFTGRTDAEAPIVWPPDVKNWLTEKTLMLDKIEGRRRRGQKRMRWLGGITNSWSLLKLMSIKSEMPSDHFMLCHPLLPPSIFLSIRVFSSESVLRIRWQKHWRFSFSISPSCE